MIELPRGTDEIRNSPISRKRIFAPYRTRAKRPLSVDITALESHNLLRSLHNMPRRWGVTKRMLRRDASYSRGNSTSFSNLSHFLPSHPPSINTVIGYHPATRTPLLQKRCRANCSWHWDGKPTLWSRSFQVCPKLLETRRIWMRVMPLKMCRKGYDTCSVSSRKLFPVHMMRHWFFSSTISNGLTWLRLLSSSKFCWWPNQAAVVIIINSSSWAASRMKWVEKIIPFGQCLTLSVTSG
mmetsp:Transcript_8281/g.18547  ORF Transcript_8281/g.18547 Transcript_8281/m.18547 type:complete len:239 (+) Transcript_8281:1671-2387(+)